jgi:hypothetical protein
VYTDTAIIRLPVAGDSAGRDGIVRYTQEARAAIRGVVDGIQVDNR